MCGHRLTHCRNLVVQVFDLCGGLRVVLASAELVAASARLIGVLISDAVGEPGIEQAQRVAEFVEAVDETMKRRYWLLDPLTWS